MQRNWYSLSPSEVIAELQSSERGLGLDEAARRLAENGANKLPSAKVDGIPTIFLRQFKSPLIYILIAASAVIFFIGEKIDALIIFSVLLFYPIVGTVQEGKAQNTLSALKKFVETTSTVTREGRELVIPDSEVVPGDIIILEEGEKIPADARVISANNLTIDESTLTGESEPIHKTDEKIDGRDLQTGDQKNIVFKGTNIVAGNGRALVVSTGTKTVIGMIAKEVAGIDTEIPLKTDIRKLSHVVILAVAAISTVIFTLGLFLWKGAREMFATVVTLSVSIIPEGLPIVMTLILASGVWRMSKKNALVKRLHAVEALGQAKIIAVDKTGTITKNEMMVQSAYVDGRTFEIRGNGYEPKGDIILSGSNIDAPNHPEVLALGKIACYQANAHVMYMEDAKKWRVSGDPTDAAMLVFAEKMGFNKNDLVNESPIIAEIPFDYSLKFHATVAKRLGKNIMSVSGAPEIILGLSDKIYRNGRHAQMSNYEKKELERIFLEMSAQGLRVIALAEKNEMSDTLDVSDVKSLSFVGFLGIRDTLREEARDAVERAKEAGIKVVMITGDHRTTALAVARDAGISDNQDEVITGDEIDDMSDEALSSIISRVKVFARVTPKHKLKIIMAYKARGEIIAMTGDGVNDAPSLVAADLGVSMGKVGTEVAKEASDIVLLDDNFGSIVSAVEEGRSIYRTIKKVILFLFSTSIGEALTILGALVIGFPLPILPAQIIWLNFVTDGFLDISLAMEPKDKDLLDRSFKRSRNLIDTLMAQRMLIMSIPMMIGTLLIFKDYFETDIAKAWTISLTTLAVFQWFNAWNCRSATRSIFSMNPFSNKFLVGATGLVIILQMFAIYSPVMQNILHTVPIGQFEWLAIITMCLSIIAVEEIRKLYFRWQAQRVHNI